MIKNDQNLRAHLAAVADKIEKAKAKNKTKAYAKENEAEPKKK